jgi:CDP-ribitol ribitolphosphotransferase
VIVRPHPLESASIEGGNVVNAQGVDVADLLPLCSAVITDYSAIAFEAAAIDVPSYFYVYDIDEYRRDTGLNIDPLVEMPEVSSRDIVALADLVKSGAAHSEVTRMLRDGYASAPAGCGERIAGRIIEALGETP